jgi:thioredoxin reductase
VSVADLDAAIIGAGPYGLSIAAHLRALGISFAIFGEPMLSWRNHMPSGMFLKSEGFASSLYDPKGSFTLRHYCAERGLPYRDIGLPVPVETFVDYGLAFQARFVPELTRTQVKLLTKSAQGFEITTTDGQTVRARRAVVAAGITHFGYLPPALSGFSESFVSHSSAHGDLSRFRNQSVAVIGGGASAIDLAALISEAGADVTLIARRESIAFHPPTEEPRPLLQQMLKPRSGLGIGLRSWLCTTAPWLFHRMPEPFRARVVERHLGPAPGWFMKDRVVGRLPLLLGSKLSDVSIADGKVHLSVELNGTGRRSVVVDHVIGATGYRVEVDRLGFIETSLRNQIRTVRSSPVLDTHFESSVPGLYLTGVASANSFGPLMRFAFGAKFAARRIAGHFGSSQAARG